MSASTQGTPAFSVKCLWCPALLPFDTDEEQTAARIHTAACAQSGNPAREVVQMTTTVKLPSKWAVRS